MHSIAALALVLLPWATGLRPEAEDKLSVQGISTVFITAGNCFFTNDVNKPDTGGEQEHAEAKSKLETLVTEVKKKYPGVKLVTGATGLADLMVLQAWGEGNFVVANHPELLPWSNPKFDPQEEEWNAAGVTCAKAGSCVPAEEKYNGQDVTDRQKAIASRVDLVIALSPIKPGGGPALAKEAAEEALGVEFVELDLRDSTWQSKLPENPENA
mmetsp:Transcript_48815/g.87906  ORF Transcript_48815/g.87906 Transcript_48815/m.87906 type:complete len:213 (+) Transcript_48815:81-719(+)|eukprot:CAMPEP_0197653050 /NCGR_PEP_ID=MMETSP1338-20131121/34821_1 /TAXON_ID=43686 ORGANISM="Pelagodinium beii, Strain RCC1491" /NCGR_SAMPLE_ID=MMETSP1338 /ASSEMBLY_ACC=CAM_ASM_000754 /LENGTH=212 /DNA_ID=CAMNT_0043228049 /DNA_START=56 /DNA_END=694 /DNA_ORIENTATION=+